MIAELGTAGESESSFDHTRMMESLRLLLDHFGAPMMTVAMSRERVMVAPWACDGTVEAEITDALAARHGLSHALDEARLHGAAVCTLLARQWPVYCTPPIVGVVSDGHGLAVSGGHPCGLTPEWLIDHLAGRARVDIILPFGRSAAIMMHPLVRVGRPH